MLKGQKFTNLDFFSCIRDPKRSPAASEAAPGEVPPAVSPAPTDRDHPKNCLCSLLPTARGTGSCGAAGNPPSSHLHVLAGSSPTCCLSRALHRAGQTQKRRQHRRLTHPIKQRGLAMSCVLRGFLIFKLLGAGQPRPDFGGDLEHGSHDAGTWQQGAGLQLGAAHTMAASQQERSEAAAKCSRGRKPPAAPSALPKAGKTQLWDFLLQP